MTSYGLEEGDWLISKILSTHWLKHCDAMKLLTGTDYMYTKPSKIGMFSFIFRARVMKILFSCWFLLLRII